MSTFLGAQVLGNEGLAPMAIVKIKILGAVLELPAKHYCQFSPSWDKGLDWHCCLAGSSKTALRILIFSIAMVADYSFDVKNIDISSPAFYRHNNSFIATVFNFAPLFRTWPGRKMKPFQGWNLLQPIPLYTLVFRPSGMKTVDVIKVSFLMNVVCLTEKVQILWEGNKIWK